MSTTIADDERLVTVVLCDGMGSVLGALEPFVVRPAFWPEADVVVEGVRERDGLEVAVLRVLTTSGGYAGGAVSYLAELVSGPRTMLTVTHELDEQTASALRSDPQHRPWWAEPGGLNWVLPFVDRVLDAHSRTRSGPLRQRKTWNLSTLLSAETAEGEVWFKATPPFLADEHGVLGRVRGVDPDLVPRVLGHDADHRALLMDHVPGADQWGLDDEAVVTAMVRRWVAVQHQLVDDIEHVLVLGAADCRAPALIPAVAALVDRESLSDLTADERRSVLRLVDTLPARFADIAACGLPDALCHGDLHPGNWRREGDRLTLLDWGDCTVGTPVLDMRAFVERLDDAELRSRTAQLWAAEWRRRIPGSDPLRAARLVEPVAQLAAAVTYQRFLDHIEETERVYHMFDPAERLRTASSVARGEDPMRG